MGFLVNANGQAEPNGGTGGLARCNVTLDGERDGFKIAKFQNTKTRWNKIDVGGGGGKWTRFKIN